MNSISKENMIKYIRHAINLEGAVIGQQNLIDEYQKLSMQKKPTQIKVIKPFQPVELNISEKEKTEARKAQVIGIMTVIFAVLFLILFITQIPGGMKYDDGSDKALVLFILLGAAIGFGIWGIISFKNYTVLRKRASELYSFNLQQRASYREGCREAEDRNRKNAENYNRELKLWEKTRNANLDLLRSKLAISTRQLQDFYEPDYIYPKYRNLPALTSIHEYLESGRCDSLTGPDGAYNLYEAELRQNIIIAQLNTVIANLEQIRRNQYTLYRELSEINDNVSRITSDIAAIRGYTGTLTALASLNTYYSAITAASASAMLFLSSVR